MSQTKEDLEAWWLTPDAWGYREHPDDIRRKSIIVSLVNLFEPYQRTLDIGCGEGFITEDLPGRVIHGIELSDIAAKRLPRRITRVAEPRGQYDLVIASGVLYEQYDYSQMTKWIEQACKVGTVVLTCHIEDWERNTLPEEKQIAHGIFPYRDYTEVWRVFAW